MLKRLLYLLLNDPLKIPSTLLSRCFRLSLSLRRNLTIGKHLNITGIPLLDIRQGAQLILDDQVMLNSRNRGYHANMLGPVKLFADRPGALIRVGQGTRIYGACIHAAEKIEIGHRCLIAANCQIMDSNGHRLMFDDPARRIHSEGPAQPVIIEDDVWLGLNCIVLPGVTIGRGSVIAANSVVTKDIPPMVIAAGNPATVQKRFVQHSDA